jgi:hypothetical protein
MKRSLVAVLLLALATVSFVGCGGETTTTTTPPATGEPKPDGGMAPAPTEEVK